MGYVGLGLGEYEGMKEAEFIGEVYFLKNKLFRAVKGPDIDFKTFSPEVGFYLLKLLCYFTQVFI